MKNFKLFFTTVLLSGIFTFNTTANNIYPAENGDPKSATEQLTNLLQQIDLTSLEGKKDLLIDFIVNSKNEILVVATSDKSFDREIKSKLNYKIMDKHKLRINVRYTIPVTFKRI